MGDAAICERCHTGTIVNGVCTNCGFKKKKSATNALPIGHLLNKGRYRIERILGEGGYSITYEAIDLQRRQRIAIKEFFPTNEFTRSSNKLDAVCVNVSAAAALRHAKLRFNEEAALLISLKDVSEIVNVYGCFEENQTAYYTMELLQGMDMQKRLIKYNRMSWQELRPIVVHILRALHAVHARGYIHRDITPDNIFLLSNGTVRLIDFGNARRYDQNQLYTAVVKDKFSPREQYDRTGNQGPWTDIYSLCVTMAYAMTGILPNKSTERGNTPEPLPPLQSIPNLPSEVSNAIRIGMSAEATMRYQSVTDFARALFPGMEIFAPSQPRKPEPVVHKAGAAASKPMLVCIQGCMKGFRINLIPGHTQTFGRGQGKVIQYHDSTPGVSRNQCSVLLHTNGVVYVKDDTSSFGTSLNGKALVPEKWYPLNRGDAISFGKETFVLY